MKVDHPDVVAAFTELKGKVDEVKQLFALKARRDGAKVNVSKTEEQNIFKASLKLDNRAKVYASHLEQDAKTAVQDDENGMRKDFNTWAPILNKIFESLKIGKVIFAMAQIIIYILGLLGYSMD